MRKKKILIFIPLWILILFALVIFILLLRNKYLNDNYCTSTNEAVEIFNENKECFYEIKEAADELTMVKNEGIITLEILPNEYISSFNILMNSKISSINYTKDSFDCIEVEFDFKTSPICNAGTFDILYTATDMSYYDFFDLGDGWYIRSSLGV